MPASTFPGSPKLLRGGLVQLDPTTRTIVDVIVFQYNPDTMTRTLQPRAMTGEPGDRLEVLRLTGPPHETIKLEAELDAADQVLEKSAGQPGDVRRRERPAARPRLAGGPDHALRRPAADDRRALRPGDAGDRPGRGAADRPGAGACSGWSRSLVGSLSITEEVFDPQLRPIRAKVSLELKVLTTSDLPITHLGSTLYLGYRRTAESLAALVAGTDVRPLGLEHLP